jgi:hypothetical protein
LDDIFGLNLNTLDMSLRLAYNDMENSGNLNTVNCKENKKFFIVTINICDEILNIIQNDINSEYLGNDQSFLIEINKILKLHRDYKVALKINSINIDEIPGIIEDKKLNDKNIIYGKNVIVALEPDVNYDLLDGFFKKYISYIEFRNVFEGSIKKDYYPICTLIFFNSKLYEYENNNLIFKKKDLENE